mmetsp:Transcript_10083/g.30520  ORF Transcript_10083/g.30520 Transcript_10083/m.30520 type:complete len:262 (-) Transcript_10083:346-1131(-)
MQRVARQGVSLVGEAGACRRGLPRVHRVPLDGSRAREDASDVGRNDGRRRRFYLQSADQGLQGTFRRHPRRAAASVLVRVRRQDVQEDAARRHRPRRGVVRRVRLPAVGRGRQQSHALRGGGSRLVALDRRARQKARDDGERRMSDAAGERGAGRGAGAVRLGLRRQRVAPPQLEPSGEGHRGLRFSAAPRRHGRRVRRRRRDDRPAAAHARARDAQAVLGLRPAGVRAGPTVLEPHGARRPVLADVVFSILREGGRRRRL